MQELINDFIQIGIDIEDTTKTLHEVDNKKIREENSYRVYMIDEQGEMWFMSEKLTEEEAVKSMEISKPIYAPRKFIVTREHKTIEILDHDNYYNRDNEVKTEE